jgi:hypothetical protein
MGSCYSRMESKLMPTIIKLNGGILSEKEVDFHVGLYMFAAAIEMGVNSQMPHTRSSYQNLIQIARLWLHYPNAAENASKIVDALQKEKDWVSLRM